MKRLIENLVTLQKIDTRLDQLKLQKGDLPQLIEQVEEDLTEKTSVITELQEKIEALEKERRAFDNEIQAGKEQWKEYEAKLYQVKNNKEYDAISSEIESKKNQIQELENNILQAMEDIEQTQQEKTELEEEVKNLTSQLKEYKTELEEISQQTEKEEAKLLQEREKVVSMFEKSAIKRYDRIRAAKNGIAVATVQRMSCGGCFSAIPPQRIVEIRKSDRLHTCEYCGRILVWMED